MCFNLFPWTLPTTFFLCGSISQYWGFALFHYDVFWLKLCVLWILLVLLWSVWHFWTLSLCSSYLVFRKATCLTAIVVVFLHFFLTCFHFRVNEKKKKVCVMQSWCACSVVNSLYSTYFSFFLAIVLSIMITTNAITIISKLMLWDSLSAAECFSGALWELQSLHITVQKCTWQCDKSFHSAQVGGLLLARCVCATVFVHSMLHKHTKAFKYETC